MNRTHIHTATPGRCTQVYLVATHICNTFHIKMWKRTGKKNAKKERTENHKSNLNRADGVQISKFRITIRLVVWYRQWFDTNSNVIIYELLNGKKRNYSEILPSNAPVDKVQNLGTYPKSTSCVPNPTNEKEKQLHA